MRRENTSKNNRCPRAARRGIEVVELAIVLPLIIFLTLATLETCEGFFLRQKLEIAANEGARVASRKHSTKQDVADAVQKYLDARGINYGGDIDSAVTVVPDPTMVGTLEPISVTVTIETSPNLRMGVSLYRYLAGKQLSGEVSMFKEYANDS